MAVVDLFCGCGGASLGFQEAQVPSLEVKVVAGVDIDEYACRTFEKMLGSPAHRVDVRQILAKKKIRDGLLREWGLTGFDRFVLIGCAPCQGFAAHRKAVRGRDFRRSLFVVFSELAVLLQPDAVFCENVPDLLARRHWPYYTRGRDLLRRAGYDVKTRIYNLAAFGLPQERFRAVMLASRTAVSMPEPLLDYEHFRTVRNAIGHLPPLVGGQTSESDPMHQTSRHRPETIDILRRVPRDGGNRPIGVGPACLDRARRLHGGYTDVYGRLAWDRPAVTITARCRTPSCGRFAHPEQDRGLSIREAALLQGFPANFSFEGPFDDKFKQVGNAVPPLVARTFAESLLSTLRSGSARRDDPLDIREPVGPGFAVTINGIKRRRSAAA
ncbi:MAG: DNA cytosine methyltransferase [Chloroflexota bacterium]|nr:DNA cytosine methyltransferase [Chloroflexota bacterium]